MTRMATRSTALITALGCGWAFYKQFYGAVTLLVPTTVALLALKELPEQQRAVKGRPRSRSASGKLESMDSPGPIRDLSGKLNLKSPPPLAPCLPPPSPPQTRRPRVSGGVVDLRKEESFIGSPWDPFFGEEPFSVEVGDIAGAAVRTAAKGGLWLVVTDDESAADEVRRGRGERAIHDPLIVVCQRYSDLILPKGRVKRIELRCLKQDENPPCLKILWAINPLQAGGELAITLSADKEGFQISQKALNTYFSPGVEERVDEELVVTHDLLWPQKSISHQRRFTYTRRPLEEMLWTKRPAFPLLF